MHARQAIRHRSTARVVTSALTAFALAAMTPLAWSQVDAQAETKEADPITEAFQGILNQLWVPQKRYTNSPHLRSVFRPVVSDVRKATVEVRADGRRVALGGIVGPDGWVVTKASRVRGAVTCRLRDGRELDAKLVGVDPALDLAMLKIDVKNVPTLDLTPSTATTPGGEKLIAVNVERSEELDETDTAEAASPTATDTAAGTLQPGDWLATVGLGRDPIAIGVMSVAPRKIEKRDGFLGVTMAIDSRGRFESHPEGVLVRDVREGGAAEAAGMLGGDVIVSVDGQPTKKPEDLKATIGGRNPGDRVRVEVLRGEERMRFLAILTGWGAEFANPAERRSLYQNGLGGDLSERRFGFESVLQHDTVLKPRDCGGPIVDLDGRVVGFNIARAGRTESYALPVDLVRGRLYELMSGRLAPKSVD